MSQQNPEFSCQHLHPSAIKTNVVILEMIKTIIKTQQTVHTHKKSVWSQQYYCQKNVGLITSFQFSGMHVWYTV